MVLTKKDLNDHLSTIVWMTFINISFVTHYSSLFICIVNGEVYNHL